jgi:hypothetical protein
MAMNTAELAGSGYLISREGTIPLVLQPAIQKPGTRERVVIPFSVAKADPKRTNLRVDIWKSPILEWLDVGLVAVLGSAALFTMLLALVAVKNM